MAARRANQAIHPSSRGARKAFTGALVCRATIARTAAKLIWKLGPTSASGQSRRTQIAATATILSESGSRPSASATSTSSAPMQLRTVGTCAPVSRV